MHDEYRRRAELGLRELDRFKRIDRRLTIVRAALFLLAALLFLMAVIDSGPRVAGWNWAGALISIAFLAVVFYHDSVSRTRDETQGRVDLYHHLTARLDRRWADVPVPDLAVPPRHEPLARDLDLVGRASLFQLINLASTPRGVEQLGEWMWQPESPDAIRKRQQAVRQLAPQLEWREKLFLRGRELAGCLTGPEEFVGWAEGSTWLKHRKGIRWASLLIPLVGLAGFLSWQFGLVSPDVGGGTLVLAVLANILISVLYTSHVHDIFNRVSTRHGEVDRYTELFLQARQVDGGEGLLHDLQRDLTEGNADVISDLKSLRRIMRAASLRHASLLSLLYFALQITVLWDFHVLARLERWQRRCRAYVRGWFESLAQLEALASLATLASEYPDWTFAEFDESGPAQLQARGLGHPLIADHVRVVNDVEVGPPGTLLLVTGSNMSGKSTLLRSIGLNAILAQAGGPACAVELRMPPVILATSMRVTDSLADGVSFYLAELRRLKQIVDEAVRYAAAGESTMLYLLDEILQGTNSVERHIAVSRVLHHLLEQKAIGAVSTHDLELAEVPELADCCQAVHFRETLHAEPGDRRMTFDYRMREGVATTTNALTLLEMVGLGSDSSESAAEAAAIGKTGDKGRAPATATGPRDCNDDGEGRGQGNERE